MIASSFAESGIDFETCLLPLTSKSSKQRQSLAPLAASAHPDRFTSSLEYIGAVDITRTFAECRNTSGQHAQGEFKTSVYFVPFVSSVDTMFSHHSMLTAQQSILRRASEISRPFTSTSSFVEGRQSYKPEASSWDTQRLGVTATANDKTIYKRKLKTNWGQSCRPLTRQGALNTVPPTR